MDAGSSSAQAQRQDSAASGATPPGRARQTSPLLTSDIFLLISEQFSPNEQALVMRALCREAWDLLSNTTTVQLSAGVPEFAFAQKWGQPGSCKDLTFSQRQDLMLLTAKSGVVANMRLLSPAASGEVGAAGCG
jgi:hypothetical protein